MGCRYGEWLGFAAALCLGWTSQVYAASLSSQLNSIPGKSLAVRGGPGAFDTFTPELVALAARGVDFPVASTTPGFSYRYNPELGLFERSSSLGPALLERAETVGAGILNLGATYLFASLTDQDGDSIEGKTSKFAVFNLATSSVTAGTETLRRFSLVANIFSLTATYGLTEKWDVNVLVPVVWTSLDVAADASSDNDIRATIGDNKLGLGDVLLRTKYRLTTGGPLDLAGGFVLRLPTAEKAEFHGLEDTTLTPLLIGSKTVGPASFYGNLGMEVNADDLERSRVRYGVGTALQPVEWLAFLVDILGSSGISPTDTVSTVSIAEFPLSDAEIRQQLRDALGIDVGVQSSGAGVSRRARLTLELDRTDILDVATGFKARLPGGVIGFASAIVPITSDGVRAEVVPTGGISYSF